MEVGRNFLSSHPPFHLKPHFRNYSPSSVIMLHELATPAITSLPTTSLTRQFPTSIFLQEQRDEVSSLLHTREDKTSQATLDRRQLDDDASFVQEKKDCASDQYLKDFEHHSLSWPGLWYLLPSLQSQENPILSLSVQSTAPDTDSLVNIRAFDVLALAKQAMLASKEAAYLAEELNSIEDDFSERPGITNSSLLEKEITVRSKRVLERRSKRRKVPIQKAVIHEIPSLRKTDQHHNINDNFDPNDPLRLFLSNPQTKQLLTAKEESELFSQVQELTRLVEVKQRLQSQFGREATFVEWAEAVGMSSGTLQLHIRAGNSSREKMVYSNFRMVVHVAKKYQGMGLDLQDLLQEGSRGLIKSLEKFKPDAGSRFSSYAYFWIRQFIRKAIFMNSRTIRLPEGVYDAMRKVKKAKELYIREGHQPTEEEVAKRVGISVDKLEMLLVSTRKPLSMQRPVWAGEPTTFQDITVDTGIETPSLCFAKEHMRQHVRNLLSILPPRERKIIRLRYGIEDGNQKLLGEIGDVFGITKERVRQLEFQAMEKLKKSASSHGLQAYTELLS